MHRFAQHAERQSVRVHVGITNGETAQKKAAPAVNFDRQSVRVVLKERFTEVAAGFTMPNLFSSRGDAPREPREPPPDGAAAHLPSFMPAELHRLHTPNALAARLDEEADLVIYEPPRPTTMASVHRLYPEPKASVPSPLVDFRTSRQGRAAALQGSMMGSPSSGMLTRAQQRGSPHRSSADADTAGVPMGPMATPAQLTSGPPASMPPLDDGRANTSVPRFRGSHDSYQMIRGGGGLGTSATAPMGMTHSASLSALPHSRAHGSCITLGMVSGGSSMSGGLHHQQLPRSLERSPSLSPGAMLGASPSARTSVTASGQRPTRLMGRDPSTNKHGDVKTIQRDLPSPMRKKLEHIDVSGLLEGPNPQRAKSTPPTRSALHRLEDTDTNDRLAHWMAAFESDEGSFASRAMFVEMRLRQALASSATLGSPNHFRCAVVCDAFERVAPLTGRFEGLLSVIWKELVAAIYPDAQRHDLIGSGARGYSQCRPYFLEAARLRALTEQMKRHMSEMREQHAASQKDADDRGQKLSQTMSKWGRAMHQTLANLSEEELVSTDTPLYPWV